jgi:hypothetical protein
MRGHGKTVCVWIHTQSEDSNQACPLDYARTSCKKGTQGGTILPAIGDWYVVFEAGFRSMRTCGA